MARVAEVLAKAGVHYKAEGLSIVSTRTPMAFGFQRMYYSNRNRFGLNPFTFISGIDVLSRSDKSGGTEIVAQVNQFRTFLWAASWFSSSGIAASGMPTLPTAVLFIAVSTLAAWLVFVSLLGGYLIKKEIADCLNG
jgi:hypothetical protein